MFLVGAFPALLVIFTGKCLREPEPWLRQRKPACCRRAASSRRISDCCSETRWRKNLVIGALLASTGVIGLWAIGEYAVDLQKNVFTPVLPRQPA